MKQRLAIAASLLGDPELIILDEPTNGLDPVGTRDVRRLIGEIANDGRTILVSSHLLSELEQVSDWLIVRLCGGSSPRSASPARKFLGATVLAPRCLAVTSSGQR